MSIATITTFGFGSYGTVNSAVVLGYLSGVIPPPSSNAIVPGVADKRKMDRDEYYRRRKLRRKKEERQLLVKVPQTREEKINVIEQPNIDLRPQKQIFSTKAAPVLPEPPMAAPIERLPSPVQYQDEDDMFMLTE